MIISQTKLYKLLEQKLGEKQAEALTDFILQEAQNNKTDIISAVSNRLAIFISVAFGILAALIAAMGVFMK